MKIYVFLLLFLLLSCKINQKKNGVEVGKWKYVSGTKKHQNIVIGKFDRNGREKGVWKYYLNDTLYRSERYFYPFSVSVLYHKNGAINEVGKSYTTNKSWTKIGTWFTYNEKGNLVDSITFQH